MPGDLRQDPVSYQQRNDDGLAEEALRRRLEKTPGSAQAERGGRSEFERDHQAPATDVLEKLVFADERAQAAEQALTAAGGVLDEVLVVESSQRGESGGHREIVLAEGGAVDDCPVHPIERAVEHA